MKCSGGTLETRVLCSWERLKGTTYTDKGLAAGTSYSHRVLVRDEGEPERVFRSGDCDNRFTNDPPSHSTITRGTKLTKSNPGGQRTDPQFFCTNEAGT